MPKLPDGVRLGLGTLTVLPVPAPARVDRRVAGQAMLLAPVVGLGLGGVAGLLAWAVCSRSGSAALGAGMALALGAVLTRGLHLDGLADTADGLGSGRPPDQALEVMKQPDIGPFGVVTLVLVLLLDVLAAGVLPARAIGVAVVTGRTVLPSACRRAVPAARPGGLGAAVAGTVPAPLALGVQVAVAVGAGAVAADWRASAAVVAALVVAEVFLRHCVGRFGGITGDVLGALVEVTTTVVLLVWALI